MYVYIYIYTFHARILSILVYFGNMYPLDSRSLKNRRYPAARLQLRCTPAMAIERDAPFFGNS